MTTINNINSLHLKNHEYDGIYTLQFQWIIPGSWVIAVIPSIPLFLATDIVKDENSTFCLYVWPQGWMAKAHSLTWLLYTILPMTLMIGMYSRVVYRLWFKHDNDNQLTCQQQVSVLLLAESTKKLQLITGSVERKSFWISCFTYTDIKRTHSRKKKCC